MAQRRVLATPFALLALAATLAAGPAPGGSEDLPEVFPRTANDGEVLLEEIPEIPQHIVEATNRYQSTRSASVQGWDEDGTGIYVTTRFGNVNQLHHVAGPGMARRQLTFFTEPVRGVLPRPGHADLLFAMDEGGSEFFQLYLLDPTEGEHRRISDGSSRNSAPAFSRDGSDLAFSSTRRDGRANDVWVMPADDPTGARLLLQAPDGAFWGPSDWSADGKSLVVTQGVSALESRTFLVDLATGERRLVAGEAGLRATHDPVGLDATGGGLLLVTNRFSGFDQLAHLDLTSGELEAITGDILWDVEGAVLSEDRSRGAFAVNEGGSSRLYLLDPEARSYRPVMGLPAGVLGGLRFSPDRRRLAFTLSSAQTPGDVFVLELGESPLEHGPVTRWTWSEVGGLDTASFVEPELVDYPTFDQVDGAPRQIPAFVYRPDSPGPHPVIVSIHGGPEAQYRPWFSSLFQMWIAQLGAAVIAPNVRGSSGYGQEYLDLDNGFLREDSVKDIGSLLDWIATQPDLDQERVAVYGGSYGGYMVLASLMHYSDRLRAGVNIVGISNFVTFLENTEGYRRDLRRVEYGDERDPEMRAFLERISPANHPQRLTAPLFVAQGQNDPRVPVTESEQIVRAVREAGYPVWYLNALNEGHGFARKENRDLFQQAVILFLQRHLLGPAGS